MKYILRLMIVTILLLAAIPAHSEVVQVLTCEQDDDATEAALEAQAVKWLKAARGMKGGDQLEMRLLHPWVAEMGQKDFSVVVIAPSLEAWGLFFDNYKGSPAAEVDSGFNDLADCADSSLWESVIIDVE